MNGDTGKLDIQSTFIVIEPSLSTLPVEVSPGLYEALDRDFHGLRGCLLLSCHEFETDWASWERHPAGDEVVLLLSGEVDMVLETASGEETVRLSKPGEYLVVPKNTWHTARLNAPVRMLFLTPGEGTENRSK